MRHLSVLFVLSLVLFSSCTKEKNKVTGYEEELIIPTYLIEEADKNPFFYIPKNYQGAQLHIYPYPYLSRLTENRVDKKYKGLILENDHVKICVLPELGGRLYYALDKSNNYDFIYRNRVIKPALIGMAGAWISGGIEWNIPHHHRVSTFMPVDYRITENEDHSKTIWVGEYEKRHQTRWIVGLTLRPDKSYVEITIKVFNTTPVVQSFLAWANTAVHANENYQVIFPPDVERAVFHSKVEFTDFPIADQYYRGIDFRNNVDLSWWKNTTSPTSFFAWDTEMDFLGGIDHGKQAGIILIGNHHIFPGKKFWNWGNNDVQRLWDQMLTDEDGPYLELMMGMYSDNQPDYTWNSPYTEKSGTMYLLPVQKLHSIKNANKDFAINLEFLQDSILLQVNATGSYQNVRIRLFDGTSDILLENLDMSPGNLYEWQEKIDMNVSREKYRVEVISENGTDLIAFQPPLAKNDPVPDTYEPPLPPEAIESTDDLYLSGLRLEQFGNPRFDPSFYYEEALDRDPNNFQVNLQMGISLFKKGVFERAETYLRRASNLVIKNYTSPKDGEPLYYLGACLFELGQLDASYDLLYKAAWFREWSSPAFYILALINCAENDLDAAMEHVRASLNADPGNIESLLLKAMLSRKNEHYSLAVPVLKQLLSLDPLNLPAFYESYLVSELSPGQLDQTVDREFLLQVLRDDPDNYLEIASRYGKAGFYADAIKLLNIYLESAAGHAGNHPMALYYMAYFHSLQDSSNAKEYQENASDALSVNCFPYGSFSAKVLEAILEKYPDDASAHYYLGNLYADIQPEKAISHWKKALTVNDTFAVCFRNIAFLEANIFDNISAALENMEMAITLAPEDPLYYAEADQYYAYLKISPENRLQRLNDHIETIKQYDRSSLAWINLNIFQGDFNTAIVALEERQFHIEEFTDINPHVQWTDAWLLKGLSGMAVKDYETALMSFDKIFEFPRNLEIPRDSKIGIAKYWSGIAYLQQGKKALADSAFSYLINFQHKTGWGASDLPVVEFYRGKSLEKIGDQRAAMEIYQQLLKHGNEMLERQPHSALDTKSVSVRQELINNRAEAYLILGLANLGLKNNLAARQIFKKALEIQPDLLDAKLFLENPTIQKYVY